MKSVISPRESKNIVSLELRSRETMFLLPLGEMTDFTRHSWGIVIILHMVILLYIYLISWDVFVSKKNIAPRGKILKIVLRVVRVSHKNLISFVYLLTFNGSFSQTRYHCFDNPPNQSSAKSSISILLESKPDITYLSSFLMFYFNFKDKVKNIEQYGFCFLTGHEDGEQVLHSAVGHELLTPHLLWWRTRVVDGHLWVKALGSRVTPRQELGRK